LRGQAAFIQRCQVHKKRNVIDHVPEEHKVEVRRKLQNAYAMADYADAKRALDRLHRELMDLNPSAARSLEEGLEETLTVHKLLCRISSAAPCAAGFRGLQLTMPSRLMAPRLAKGRRLDYIMIGAVVLLYLSSGFWLTRTAPAGIRWILWILLSTLIVLLLLVGLWLRRKPWGSLTSAAPLQSSVGRVKSKV
jgi:hypothetical protein